jgi:predicted transcriptional regulator
MTALNVRLPESIHRRLRVLAEQEGISLNSLIASAVTEKIAILDAETVLLERAKRGSVPEFKKLLTRVPNTPPLAGDELES